MKPTLRVCATLAIVVFIFLNAVPARAGHSRFPYLDGGQSADGRFVVTVERVETPPPSRRQPAGYEWQYTWRDTREDQIVKGKLEGLRSGRSSVQDPVHGHIFVSPDGQTFAVWNPQVLAPTAAGEKPPWDLTARASRDFPGFTHRLTIYRHTGEIVRRLDLKDFLDADDWNWLYCFGCQVYWQLPYPGLDTHSAPRPGYALYRVSPDYTVLETTIGANDEGARKATERGITPRPPRTLRVDLITGRIVPRDQWLTDAAKVLVQPFNAPLAGKDRRQEEYRPSLDPVRVEGRYDRPDSRPDGGPN